MKSWHDECGVFGIWNHSESSRLTYLGLFALQHRGQESAGIVTLAGSDAEPIHLHHKGLGLVSDVFNEAVLDQLKGRAAVGHVRYSTTGQNLLTNAQPIVGNLVSGPVAIAHNGNFVNAAELRDDLKNRGAIFHGSNDTECLLHLMAHENPHEFMGALKKSVE
ncbi:MAG: class II glutamine amidotransferase, partial [Bdellovibrionales bacterium]|nr:class II glutamine amidotransferase [Bdellovibrionales bacterium]